MKFIDMNTSKELPHQKLDDSPYRRGYLHGYLNALENINAGASIEKAFQFVDNDLRIWRESDRTQFISPPCLKTP